MIVIKFGKCKKCIKHHITLLHYLSSILLTAQAQLRMVNTRRLQHGCLKQHVESMLKVFGKSISNTYSKYKYFKYCPPLQLSYPVYLQSQFTINIYLANSHIKLPLSFATSACSNIISLTLSVIQNQHCSTEGALNACRCFCYYQGWQM